MRPLAYRTSEHHTSFNSYEGFAVAKWNNISEKELVENEERCLKATKKYCHKSGGECRNGISAAELWEKCKSQLVGEWTEPKYHEEIHVTFNIPKKFRDFNERKKVNTLPCLTNKIILQPENGDSLHAENVSQNESEDECTVEDAAEDESKIFLQSENKNGDCSQTENDSQTESKIFLQSEDESEDDENSRSEYEVENENEYEVENEVESENDLQNENEIESEAEIAGEYEDQDGSEYEDEDQDEAESASEDEDQDGSEYEDEDQDYDEQKSAAYGETEYIDDEFIDTDETFYENTTESKSNIDKIIERCNNYDFSIVPDYNFHDEKWLSPNFKTMPHDQKLRIYQLECCQKIVKHFAKPIENEKTQMENEKTQMEKSAGLVRMFCGTGKSRILQEMLYHYSTEVTATPKIFMVVFPSLALINQFDTNYMSHFKKKQKLMQKVCSENDATTSPDEIKMFLAEKTVCKIFLVTYQSLDLLLGLVPHIDFAFYDEAHHVTEQVVRNLIFEKYAAKINKKLYFTATPVNRKGIFMTRHDEKTGRDEIDTHEILNCGELIFNYSYLNGLLESRISETKPDRLIEIHPPVLQKFAIQCTIWPEQIPQPMVITRSAARKLKQIENRQIQNKQLQKNMELKITELKSTELKSTELKSTELNTYEELNRDLYEILIECILETKNCRVLTFHNSVNSIESTSVSNFTNEIALQKILQQMDKEKQFKKLSHYKIEAGTNAAQRKIILDALENCPDNEIVIVSSCRTISEGIDVKSCDAAFFVDVKSSVLEIIQILGRIVRKKKHDRPASIILPIRLNRTQPVEEQLVGENIAFKQLLDVLSSIKQEDPSLYYALVNQTFTNGRPENTKNKSADEPVISPNIKKFSGFGINFKLKNYESLFNFKIEQFSGRVLILENEKYEGSSFEKNLTEIENFILKHNRRPNERKKEEKTLAYRLQDYNKYYRPGLRLLVLAADSSLLHYTGAW
jgi:superfamily II DNA or RNA helicase